MWRHTWFKILLGLQLVNFAAMVLLEQQRRSIWDKEATNAQKILDTKYFTEKTEGDFRYVARLLENFTADLSRVQAEAAKSAGSAELIRDTRERVLKIEAALPKLQPEKQP
jgi:hypothetical protein